MIKIGIECESIEEDSWGVARMVYKLLEELAKDPELHKRFRFFLYFKSRIPEYPFLSSQLFVKKITRPLWFPSSFNLHYQLWMIAQAYRDNVSMIFFPNYMLPFLWFRKSMVMLTDDIYHEIRNPQLLFRYRLAYWLFANWAARRATKIMAISESSKRELIRLFSIESERIFVNYLGVDRLESVDHYVGGGDYLLYVGQMFPRRHAKETIQAFEKIAPQFPNFKFVMVGMDKYRPPQIRRLVETVKNHLGDQRIVWKEYVPQKELDGLYQGARTVIYVSDREAFGLPPMEGLSHGVVPVVADTPVNRELYDDLAFFVEMPATVDSIAHALARTLTDQEARQRISGQSRRILEKYTWGKHAKKWINVTEETIKNSA